MTKLLRSISSGQYGSSPRQLWPGELSEYDKVAAIAAPRPLPISPATCPSIHVGYLLVELKRAIRYIEKSSDADIVAYFRFSGLVNSLTEVLVMPDDIPPE